MRTSVLYAVRMTAPQRKLIQFPSLAHDEQLIADEWLDGYLRLLVRIDQENVEHLTAPRYPQPPVDERRGTGTVGTPP